MDLAPKLTDAIVNATTAAAAALNVTGESRSLEPTWRPASDAVVLVATLPAPGSAQVALIVQDAAGTDDAAVKAALSACIADICTALGLDNPSMTFTSDIPASFSVIKAVESESALVAVGYIAAVQGQAVIKGQDTMKRLNDVEMVVTAELGRAKLTVREILSMVPGNVVELDRLAGAPIDLLVNGKLVARGEVVVIDEEFGVRVTEVVGNED
jgi:flagellar motor switch protein FliN/FliY